MKVTIIAVGRMKSGPERDLVARYLDRAKAGGRQLGLLGFDIIELAESRSNSGATRKREEMNAILAATPKGATLVALDEKGKSMSSAQLTNKISDWRDNGISNMCVIIGGADGLDPELRKTAQLTIAFSPLTWPHQLVRIMLVEQLYRATTILSGHPYHRGD